MAFEYDARKSLANKDKHGIDFEAAKALWDDPDYLETPVQTTDESRTSIIGKIGAKYWTAIITYRKNNIRIISLRRSRKKEIDAYEED